MTHPFHRRGVLLGSLAVGLGSNLPLLAQIAPTATLSGPKKRIAVLRFTAIGKFLAAAGPEGGEVLADQFSSALAQSNLFDVVDRSDVTTILKEQALTPKSATQGAAADNAADLLGAQVLVHGAVTSFDNDSSGGGLSLGGGVGNLAGVFGQSSSKGALGVDFRLVDTTTGRVIWAKEIKEEVVSKSRSFGVQSRNGQLSQDNFHNTPLGLASAKVFQKAIPLIADALKEVVWTGRVADVVDGAVLLNVGAQNGVTPGQVFAISRITRRIIDPQSGGLLGVLEAPVGQVTIADVADRFARAQADAAVVAQRGDVARFIR